MTSKADVEALLASLKVEVPVPEFPDSDIVHKPIDLHRAYLADEVSKKLERPPSLAYEAVQVVAAVNPKDNSDLDLVLPKLKLQSEKPKNIAKEVSSKFASTPLFQRPLADGVHLRFFFSHQTLPQIALHYINSQWTAYGTNPALSRRDSTSSGPGSPKVIIDFSRPKLASEFTSANLRGAIIGAQVANLHKAMGWDIIRLNYLGDWGKDLGLLAVGWARFGSEESFQKDPMGHVLEVYERISALFEPEKEARKAAREVDNNAAEIAEIETKGLSAERDAFFKRMEDGDAEAVALWKRIRDVSIDNYKKDYARLNVEFDEFSGESQISPKSIEEVETVLKEKGFCAENEGSWIIDYTMHGPKNLGTGTLRGRTGSTSYLLRDIAAVLDRAATHNFDKMIYVVDSSQDSHFQKVFQALRYMGRDDLADKLEHVSFGKVNGMSQQLGKTHLLGDIVDQVTSAAKDVLGTEEKHADIEHSDASAATLGVTALIAQDALNKKTSSYTFSSKTLASFEPGTGLGLQATLAKLHAKIVATTTDAATLANVDYSLLGDEEYMEVLRLLLQFPEVTSAAYRSNEPSLIMGYLLRLMEELSNLLDDGDDDDDAGEGLTDKAPGEPDPEEPEEPDEPASPEAILAQAVLYKHVQQVLYNGLRLLGISPIA